MPKNPIQKRVKSLFAKMERLASNPIVEEREFRAELDALRVRLQELEAEIAQSEAAPAVPSARSEGQVEARRPARDPEIRYETERLGVILSNGAVQPLRGARPPALPANEVVSAPFTAGGRVIGKMDLQTAPNRTWSADETKLIETVARQASQQIENLRLLAAAERARVEAEAATREFIHENWDAYLDAIHQGRRVGFAYDHSAVAPFTAPPQADGVQESIHVMEEQVGSLFLQPDPSRPLTDEDREIVAAIAQRVSQQVENLRLLADASRARAEAEAATRRLTREAWEAYSKRGSDEMGFVYDSNQVKPLKDAELPQTPALDLPLNVRGETVGSLAVMDKKEISPEAAQLASAIAERVSTQLETLRLADELQKRAAELQTVARLSTTASAALNPDELLQSVVDMTKDRFGLYHAHIYLANDAWNTLLLAAGAGELGRKLVEKQDAIPYDAEKSLVARAARERKTVIVNDARAEPGFLPNPLLPDTRSEMAVPMIVGEQMIGVFDVQSERAHRFSEEDANIYSTLTAQVSVALQNARLYAEQAATVAQLRELDRLKSSFLANMSHELRTPLNSILGFADVILEGLDGPLTDTMDNDLRLIQKNGQHLLNLINDVLDMAKIEAGRMNLNPERFLVHELIADVISIASPLASERDTALFIAPEADLSVEVNADRTRLRQVMINIVNNAIKFTEHGRISVNLTRIPEHALIAVHDNGLGIPPEKLEEIFSEFTQVDTSTTRKVGGTGLGLPISRRLVEMHGGRLWAESSGVPGEGSTFYVELPLEARIAEPIIEKQVR